MNNDTPSIYFPKARGRYIGADGQEKEFLVQILATPVSLTVGFGGKMRTLRDRLPDNTPGQVRRLTMIEQASRLIPHIATVARYNLRDPHSKDSWAMFSYSSITLTTRPVDGNLNDIEIEYIARAGTDTVILTSRDPVTMTS
ncbi:unnamed protein product [Peniophora sp. CBMAI 1063]|nr:unnamed protein product [Peniophora sp. CBMAI 1063]